MPRFLRIASLFLGVLFCALASLSAAAKKPNVIFILVDDFGWTDLSSFGSDFYQTPAIDRLAQSGMRFDNAYAACTVCSPTRAAVMTGQYPARLHITDWIAGHKKPFARLQVPNWTQALDPSYYTLAEALKDAGYATAHVGKWHLGADPKYWPEHHGFDLNRGGYSGGAPSRRDGGGGYFSPYRNPRLTDGPEGEHLEQRLAREAVAFIEENQSRPFFLNLWTYGVHTPLQAQPEKIAHYKALVKSTARHQNPTYAAMLENLDETVATVLATLDRLKLRENTLIVFIGDNGGLLATRGDDTKAPTVTNNAPLRLGKGQRYEGGVRVPLIVSYPAQIKPGKTNHTPIISPDFYPTLLTLTGTARKDQQFDGVDFSAVLKGESDTLSRQAIFWHYPHYHNEGAVPYSAIRKGDWKLIENLEDQSIELFNLADDLGEKTNLAAIKTAKRDELIADLRAWRTQVGAQMPMPNPKFDATRAKESPGKGKSSEG